MTARYDVLYTVSLYQTKGHTGIFRVHMGHNP